MTSKEPHSLKSTIVGTVQYVSLRITLSLPLNLTQSYYTCTRTRYSKIVEPFVPHQNPASSETKSSEDSFRPRGPVNPQVRGPKQPTKPPKKSDEVSSETKE
ncbi:hypothetical protein CPB84DRAFT_1850527 [Gymnopilus junonius]|uniref:Uncharacterized protein n=1 Tax=Gymnopilus junonius TaxID=109634 RepID=A0A9P5NGH7_GYMJU|nr:hypothetical protein CPB84DRAFT_1850527 [Gymnopilus junonius]